MVFFLKVRSCFSGVKACQPASHAIDEVFVITETLQETVDQMRLKDYNSAKVGDIKLEFGCSGKTSKVFTDCSSNP